MNKNLFGFQKIALRIFFAVVIPAVTVCITAVLKTGAAQVLMFCIFTAALIAYYYGEKLYIDKSRDFEKKDFFAFEMRDLLCVSFPVILSSAVTDMILTAYVIDPHDTVRGFSGFVCTVLIIITVITAIIGAVMINLALKKKPEEPRE